MPSSRWEGGKRGALESDEGTLVREEAGIDRAGSSRDLLYCVSVGLWQSSGRGAGGGLKGYWLGQGVGLQW